MTNAFQNRTLTDSITVDYYSFNELSIQAEWILCEAQQLELVATGANERETYRWYDGNREPLEKNSGTFTTPILSQNTNYFVAITNGTCVSDPVQISILYDQVTAKIVASDTIVNKGDPVMLDGSGGVTYHWSPATWLDHTNRASVTSKPEDDIEYTLTVFGNHGCMATDSIKIYIEKAIYVPNAFSPNGDEFNDTWKIINLERFPNNTIQIYNRWGEMVYSFKGYYDQWDGTMNGKELPGTTYTYHIDLGDSDFPPQRGTVKIIR